MTVRLLLPLVLAAGSVAAPAATPAQQSTAAPAQQSTAGRAADRFSIDMPAETSVTAPGPAPAADAPSAPPSNDIVPATGASVSYTLDTPIRDLIANPATRAVLDRNLPGLSTDENLPKFDRMGLREFQPLTGGQLTGPMLAEMAKDLARIGGAPLKAAPARVGAPRTRDESR